MKLIPMIDIKKRTLKNYEDKIGKINIQENCILLLSIVLNSIGTKNKITIEI